MKTAIEILKHNQLSKTDSRLFILNLFLESPAALSHGDIEKRANDSFDRVTVYRTLQVFAQKGIIHQIPTTDTSTLYALCKEDCEQGHHHDNHVHFICSQCNHISCLDEVLVPPVRLPDGFLLESASMNISGVCINCR